MKTEKLTLPFILDEDGNPLAVVFFNSNRDRIIYTLEKAGEDDIIKLITNTNDKNIKCPQRDKTTKNQINKGSNPGDRDTIKSEQTPGLDYKGKGETNETTKPDFEGDTPKVQTFRGKVSFRNIFHTAGNDSIPDSTN